MHSPRFRVRTLMMAVWLSALAVAGAVDVLEYCRIRGRVEVLDEHNGADGSRSATLLYGYSRCYYMGPVPLGPCPTAVFSGVAFAATIFVWMLRGRGERRTR